MKQKAVDILQENRLMAIATLRPDGWPQATMVSYANDDILIYFIVSRQSQKFANSRNQLNGNRFQGCVDRMYPRSLPGRSTPDFNSH